MYGQTNTPPSRRGPVRKGLGVLALALLLVGLARDVAPSDKEHAKLSLNRITSNGASTVSDLCSARNAVGVGLRGEYFAKVEWQGVPLLSRTDPSIDFDASLDWPSHTPAPRSVRWQGWVKAPISGTYRFHVEAAPARVSVARQDVVGGDRGQSLPIELQAGRFYPITVEIAHLDARPRGPLMLEWTAPHGARYVVPRSLLFLPTETAMRPPPRPSS